MRKLDAKETKWIVFLTDVMLFKDYINFMEEFLEAEKNKQEENLRKIDSAVDPNDLIVLDRRILFALTDEFAGILRRSFFISLFSFFENRLINEYRSGRNSEYDTHGELQRAINYFTKDSQIVFPNGVPDVIQNYRIIRNCIVHAQGMLNEMKPAKDKQKLLNYLQKDTHVFLSKEKIRLKAGFCEEALQNIEVFLRLVLFPDELKR